MPVKSKQVDPKEQKYEGEYTIYAKRVTGDIIEEITFNIQATSLDDAMVQGDKFLEANYSGPGTTLHISSIEHA